MLNQCTFIGNLGADPDIRTMQNGDKVANLSLAVTESWKDKTTGERKEKTEWIKIVVFGGLTSICESYLSKGSKIYVSGKFKTRDYEKDGEKKYSTEIVLQGFDSKLVMLSNKSERQPESAHVQDDMDDEIPF